MGLLPAATARAESLSGAGSTFAHPILARCGQVHTTLQGEGVLAGTYINGVIQSSTAMTVVVVGLVNAGVVGLRPAISVIMGANIGITLGTALPRCRSAP